MLSLEASRGHESWWCDDKLYSQESNKSATRRPQSQKPEEPGEVLEASRNIERFSPVDWTVTIEPDSLESNSSPLFL
ncbi:hypothetical protein RRG08_041941 [Elysia crispata]|uniref:Uncharacterized protein n=1 Tax=Elysia crispata TaxID=231223 RepID=A0AAE1CNN4_9GAST|nr:hypothetical protein RRG08_041941 [Elysia crispata]